MSGVPDHAVQVRIAGRRHNPELFGWLTNRDGSQMNGKKITVALDVWDEVDPAYLTRVVGTRIEHLTLDMRRLNCRCRVDPLVSETDMRREAAECFGKAGVPAYATFEETRDVATQNIILSAYWSVVMVETHEDAEKLFDLDIFVPA